jgi:hypothetical protein
MDSNTFDNNVMYFHNENTALKYCSGCGKMCSAEMFGEKKTCNMCRLSNKSCQERLRADRKRQRKEEYKNIEEDHVYIEDLAEIIIENIIKFKENTQPNNDNNIFELFCFIDIMEFYDDSKVIADNIVDIISEADEYNWMYVNIIIY